MKLTTIAVTAALALCGSFAYAQKRRAERPRFHDRRSRSKFCYARFVADHGQFDEAEPERKWNVHVGR
jgi:hypothetical protein